MKKLIPFACCVLSIFFANAQDIDFVLRGKLTDVKEPLDVVLEYHGEEQKLVSNDGTFEFKGKCFPTDATLKTMPHHPTLTMQDTAYWFWAVKKPNLMQVRYVFLDGNVNITGKRSLKDAVVSGMAEQDTIESYKAKEASIDRAIEKLKKVKSPAGKKNRLFAQERLLKEKKDLPKNFVREHPDNYFSLFLVSVASSGDPVTFEGMLNSLSDRLRDTKLGKDMLMISDGNRNNRIGNPAPDFTQYTMSGEPVKLSSYRGKYVLVDFWASWCVFCREENPNVVKAYNKFKDENLQIISISIDAKKENWIKAVKEDKLPWLQVSELSGGNNTVSLAYAIKGIPSNVLIDPNGVIIAKDLRGAALHATLAKVFKK